MCGCPPHLVEVASQAASSWGMLAPFAATVVAALTGGKIGQFFLKWHRRLKSVR
jgi:hypothetical protein